VGELPQVEEHAGEGEPGRLLAAGLTDGPDMAREALTFHVHGRPPEGQLERGVDARVV
jgi:hypothetical protein